MRVLHLNCSMQTCTRHQTPAGSRVFSARQSLAGNRGRLQQVRAWQAKSSVFSHRSGEAKQPVMTTPSLAAMSSCVPPPLQCPTNGLRTVMRKEGIHPEYFEEAKVFCNGEEVLTVSGSKVSSSLWFTCLSVN